MVQIKTIFVQIVCNAPVLRCVCSLFVLFCSVSGLCPEYPECSVLFSVCSLCAAYCVCLCTGVSGYCCIFCSVHIYVCRCIIAYVCILYLCSVCVCVCGVRLRLQATQSDTPHVGCLCGYRVRIIKAKKTQPLIKLK